MGTVGQFLERTVVLMSRTRQPFVVLNTHVDKEDLANVEITEIQLPPKDGRALYRIRLRPLKT